MSGRLDTSFPRRAGLAGGLSPSANAKSCVIALPFRAPGTSSSLGVRPTVLRGPGNSVRRHNRAAFLRFVQKHRLESIIAFMLADPTVAETIEKYARLAREPDLFAYQGQRNG